MTHTRRRYAAALTALLLSTIGTVGLAQELDLAAGFTDPPASARPRVWWHWMNGNVSTDGIEKDLAWMKRVGIGGLQNFDANLATPQVVDKRLVYMTPQWKEAFGHAVGLADQLGLEFAIAASPGWSETGGPWVKPEDGIKKLVWSETDVAGGRRFTGKLAPPPSITGPFQTVAMHDLLSSFSGEQPKTPPTYYADTIVLAYPASATAAREHPRITLAARAAGGMALAQSAVQQPVLAAHSKPILVRHSLRFKDLNANGRVDPYEDWRLPPEARARDLVQRMTLAEKAGAMLIVTNNPDCGGGISERGTKLIDEQKVTRFILRSRVSDTAPDCSVKLTGPGARNGYPQTPLQMAGFTNAVQQRLEAKRLGIPGLFKDNARNHVETNPMFGITGGAGALTEFPKEAGLAAAALGSAAPVTRRGGIPSPLKGDMSIFRQFAATVGEEWRAIGLRGMYGPTADLGTEPRWSRFHETFTEDADLMSQIIAELVSGLQGPARAEGTSLTPRSAVALTIKHFPGGGPQEMGLDPHYTFGKNQVYLNKGGKYGFGYHLKPFRAAIAAGASSIMPYYGVPVNATYQGVRYDQTGMAFSKQIVTDLLREKLGFKGNVNSDSNIIEGRAWGLEGFRLNPATGKPYDNLDRLAAAVRSGTDVLSEFSDPRSIVEIVAAGTLFEKRDIDPAVTRLLTEQFQLGLFENPYVDAQAAASKIGTPRNRAAGLDIQRRSVVLLKNDRGLLPLKPNSNVYTLGFKAADVGAYGYNVIDGNAQARPPVPAGTDAVLIKVLVTNEGAQRYRSNDPSTGGRAVPADFPLIDPQTSKRQATWGAQDPCVYDPANAPKQPPLNDPCLDNRLVFGGAFPWEAGMLALSEIARAESWTMTPSLHQIQQVMGEVGDPRKVVVSIYFRNPYVLDEASGVRRAGALLATFGVSDKAQLDVISGRSAPQGRLPFALPASSKAVGRQNPDAPGYSETSDGTLYPFGHGLAYR